MSVIYFVGKFIGNKKNIITNEFIAGKSTLKKIIRFIPLVFLSGSLSYNKKKYRMKFRR
jgi:hypothetical protein